jgi:DNA-binding response OmpR family regulator
MARVMVVDDDVTVREVVVTYLRAAGYDVGEAADGESALHMLREDPADLLVLDLMLPGIDGLEVCRRLRAKGDGVPVIMLTALGSETDRVVGLERGADDYVTKPFSAAELIARIRAVLRRTGEQPAGENRVLESGDVRVDLDTHQATLAGEPLDLTVKEFELLRVLLSRAGKLVRREELVREVWDENWFGSSKTLDVHVSALRRKLGDDPADPRHIHTIRGVGFRFAGPDDPA